MKTINIKGLVLSGLIALTGFSSCQVVNKYKSPEVNSENLFRDLNPTDTTSIAYIPWKEYFKDPYLQSYIEEALSNNYNMLIVEQRIKQAEAALGMSRAAYFPNLAIAGQMEQTRLSSADPLTKSPQKRNTLAYHKETYSLGLVASWEIDLWGKLNRQSRAKYAQMLNSYAGKNLIRSSLISSLANTYYTLLALDDQLKVTNEMITLMEKNLSTMGALKEAGMTNAAAVEQTKAALAGARASVPDLESKIRQLENVICTVLGRKPGAIERSSLATQSVTANLNTGVPAQMLANRPDVNQAELEFRSAFELTNVARAGFYPNITLSTGTLGYSTVNGFSNFFKPENIFASIIGGITQPLFARKQLITQLKVAKA
ncbi:MAG: TolC family protein, partial [Dysgonamonadaceae bacterium]|nr:TolC family protein [Dysgonamonadaceae bacterium]